MNKSILSSQVACLLACLLGAGLPATSANAAEWTELAAEHRYRLDLSNGLISGPGGELLSREMQAADFVMLGENHGTRDIAELVQALYLDSIRDGARILVTEIGPASATAVERMHRADEFREFMAQGINLQAVPFFSMVEELPLLDLAIANNPSRRAIWGLDQEFMAAAPLLFDELESMAEDDAQREAVASARRTALLNPFLLGMGDDETLRELHVAFASSTNPAASKLTDQLLLTHKIYSEQMGGDAAWSNERRETLMFENFLDYVAGTGNTLPRMFFKFGGFHLYNYRSPTVREAALGKRVTDWAKPRGLKTLHIYAECAGGQALEPLLGGETECEPLMAEHGKVFTELLFEEGVTLFDLRPLREAEGVDDLHWRVGYLLQGFDFLLLVPDTRASRYAEGTLVLHRYGAIAIALLVLLLGGVGWLILRWRRKRRARAH